MAANATTSLLRGTGSISSSAPRRLLSSYCENSSEILPCRIDPLSPNRDAQIRKVIEGICPSLLSANETPVIEPLLGGLSNELFVWKRKELSVLFRIHPDSTAMELVDREVENRILAMLSKQGDAPLFLGRYQNGRVEEFFNNYVPLSCHEMKDHAGEIGKLMARMHSKVVPASVLEPSEHGDMWERVDGWLKFAQEGIVAASNDNSDARELLPTLVDEWKWLKPRLRCDSEWSISNSPIDRKARTFVNDIVLAHMDCQSLNLLRPKEGSGPLRVIDFEYAGFNPRGIDIANTFCEHCDMNNMKADWEAEYPSEFTQLQFFRSYLSEVEVSPCEQMTTSEVDEFVARLRFEVGRYTLLSHLSWAVWGLVNDRISDIEFDYVKYTRHRMCGYQYFRNVFFE